MVIVGNDALHVITKVSRGCVLRMEVKTLQDETAYSQYANFTVDNEANGYKIKLGKYSGPGKGYYS